MQFSFLGFSVKKVMELELDIKDLAILRYFQDFMNSGKMNYEEVNGVKYYWISYKNISEEMPFLGLSKRTIMMRMLRLRDLGLLSHYTKKEGGTFSYYTLGTKFKELLYKNENNKLDNSKSNTRNTRNTRNKVQKKTTDKSKSISKNNCNKIKDSTLENLNNSEAVIEDLIDKNAYKQVYKEVIGKYEYKGSREVSNKSIEIYDQQNRAQNKRNEDKRETYKGMYIKEEGVRNLEDSNEKNRDTLSIGMNKGYSEKCTTKTNLLNNTSTINTNYLINIKSKIEFILDYLNTRANVKYRITNKKTVNLIIARLKEGFTVEDFKIVIDKKISEWKNTDFEQYLNPFTLFSDKFELYLNQKTKIKNNEEYFVNADRNRALTKRSSNNSDTKKLRFNNFKGRDFDYEKIEEQLLGWV